MSRSTKSLLLGMALAAFLCLLVALALVAATSLGILRINLGAASRPTAVPRAGFILPSPTSALPSVAVPLPVLPATPSVAPPPSATPTPTEQPTTTPTPTPTPTYTPIPPTPTPTVPPGLYVTNLRPEPAQLGERQDAGFYATFLNATGRAQAYRWLVYIYKPDNFRHSFGETASQVIDIPVGVSEQKTFGIWRIGVGTCGGYVGRVAWLDEFKNPTFFSKPDGQMYELPFTVCPP